MVREEARKLGGVSLALLQLSALKEQIHSLEIALTSP
jgi:hypothetical protein